MGKDPIGPRRKEPTIRHNPRPRRQVGGVTFRLAKLSGCFRYDEGRDAHVLRLVGNRIGPVLRTRPPIDSAAAQIEWSDSMERLAARRKTGRFARETEPTDPAQRGLIEH